MSEKLVQDNEAVYLAGGLALMVFGAGMILANPAVRQFLLGQLANMGDSEDKIQGLAGVLPDLERYMKIRAM